MDRDQFHSMYDFSGRTILITGGAGVLGIGIARMLVECNANVVILSRSQERGIKSITEINEGIQGTGRAVYLQGDVLETDTLQKANENIRAQFGNVVILINAAGGNHPSAT